MLIPKTNNPIAYNYYCLLLCILIEDMPPTADAAFQAMATGEVIRVRYTMPLQEIIECSYLNEVEGWHYYELAELTGYSLYKVFRNVKRYRNMQPIA